MLLSRKSGQAFGGEAVDGIHGDAVAVGVGEALVDPVAAADGELVDVELAGGEHDLAGGAVDVVAVDVDVGKVVVGADLLNLAEGVLEGAPVPEADVLEGGLVVGGVGGVDGGFGGKLLLVEAVETEGLAGDLDVVGDVRALADELVGLDDEVGDVPADEAEGDVADSGGKHGGGDEAASRDAEGVEGGDDGAGDESEGDEEEAVDGDVGVGVVEAVEDGVVIEEELEAADVDHHGDDEEEEGEGDGEAAPGRCADDSGVALVERAGAAGDDEVDGGGGADGEGEGEEPVVEKIPGGEGEEVEVERLGEDGVDDAAGGVGGVPEEGEGGPVRQDGGAGDERDDDGDGEGEDAEDGLDGEVEGLAAEDDGVGGGEVGAGGRGAERGEGEEEDEEGEDGDGEEDAGLQGDHFPEDVAEAERAEPVEVDPGGEDGGEAEDEGENDEAGEDEDSVAPGSGLAVASSRSGRPQFPPRRGVRVDAGIAIEEQGDCTVWTGLAVEWCGWEKQHLRGRHYS